MKSLLLLLATLSSVPAASLSFTDFSTVPIPDGDSSGLLRVLTVNAPGENILGVEVDLRISATELHQAFLGDLYVYLTNGTSLAVLTNRAGRRESVPAGYSDDQTMTVTFTTTGADFHNYRLPVTGSHTIALNTPLTGSWQADGRAVDPAVVLDTTPRTAGLNLFTGQAASGTWRLFAADLSLGGEHQLAGWELRLNTVTIPEPGSAALLAVGIILGRRRRR